MDEVLLLRTSNSLTQTTRKLPLPAVPAHVCPHNLSSKSFSMNRTHNSIDPLGVSVIYPSQNSELNSLMAYQAYVISIYNPIEKSIYGMPGCYGALYIRAVPM